MTQYFFPIMFVVSFIAIFLVIRKDTNEDKSLTKKGFIKLIVMIVIIFLSAFSIVFLTNS
ncbi:hypothetical protein [Radiobacillus sp. PE A8.2]|uniref:hypothetical protein n=1 Tax=Radiobacillus sp. PE A8.2 TaxID=3380349 RepID=UPI00388DCC47